MENRFFEMQSQESENKSCNYGKKMVTGNPLNKLLGVEKGKICTFEIVFQRGNLNARYHKSEDRYSMIHTNHDMFQLALGQR